ncbi:hypothetical protein [Brevibacillus sp. NRS-1366]|uniref:hypothetical protein n=1 Tax=Brevibacillus sp. NRS-1366 TaxID=3233899 RepID=UPI003D191831
MRRMFQFLTLFLLLMLLVQSTASAHHPYSPKRHIVSTHLRSVDEYFCVETAKSSSWSQKDAYTTIRDILYAEGGWDELANNRVYFFGQGYNSNCSDLTSAEEKETTFRYYIEDNTNSTVKCDDETSFSKYSCIRRYGLVKQPDGHEHWNYGVAYIRSVDLTNGGSHTINHETGHLLGLIDGGTKLGNSCTKSIMHSRAYGCSTNYAQPTQLDLDSVDAEVRGD